MTTKTNKAAATKKTTARQANGTKKAGSPQVSKQARDKADKAGIRPIPLKKAKELVAVGLMTQEAFDAGIADGRIKSPRPAFLTDDINAEVEKVFAHVRRFNDSHDGVHLVLRAVVVTKDDEGKPKKKSRAVTESLLS